MDRAALNGAMLGGGRRGAHARLFPFPTFSLRCVDSRHL